MTTFTYDIINTIPMESPNSWESSQDDPFKIEQFENENRLINDEPSENGYKNIPHNEQQGGKNLS